jgi:hypothetical protein
LRASEEEVAAEEEVEGAAGWNSTITSRINYWLEWNIILGRWQNLVGPRQSGRNCG